MRPQIGTFFICISIILLSSCSTVQKVAIGQTGSIIYKASVDEQVENDWEMFSTTMSGNIKLLESLLSQDSENQDLIVSLIKAYAGKGFGIDETRFLEDKYQDKEDSIHRTRALVAYTRALELGARFLKINGLDESVLSDNLSTPDVLIKKLSDELSDNKRDVEAVAHTAQALGGLINLQKGNMRVIGYVPVMKALFDWSCTRDDTLAYGLCDIFYATYDASRPRMLGGNPLEGKKKFLKAIERWPENLLVRTSYIEQYAIPMLDDTEYRHQKVELDSAVQDNMKIKIWNGNKIQISEKKYTNIYNMIAAKRISIIQKYENDIF